jgi:hypothetical protein
VLLPGRMNVRLLCSISVRIGLLYRFVFQIQGLGVRYRECEKKKEEKERRRSIIVAFDIDVSLGSRGIVGMTRHMDLDYR